MTDTRQSVIIHTAAALPEDTVAGGYAGILECGTAKRTIAGAQPAATENRLELLAVTRSLEHINKPCDVEIRCQNEYVVKGINRHRFYWQQTRGKTTRGTPAANWDLWTQLNRLAQKLQLCANLVSDTLTREELLRTRKLALKGLRTFAYKNTDYLDRVPHRASSCLGWDPATRKMLVGETNVGICEPFFDDGVIRFRFAAKDRSTPQSRAPSFGSSPIAACFTHPAMGTPAAATAPRRRAA